VRVGGRKGGEVESERGKGTGSVHHKTTPSPARWGRQDHEATRGAMGVAANFWVLILSDTLQGYRPPRVDRANNNTEESRERGRKGRAGRQERNRIAPSTPHGEVNEKTPL